MCCSFILFFFNDTATTEIYTLSLHDALPISRSAHASHAWRPRSRPRLRRLPMGPRWRRCSRSRSPPTRGGSPYRRRSEEHTSELQSRQYLVCRLLLEKKKKIDTNTFIYD